MPKKISEIFAIPEEILKQEGVFNSFIDIDAKFYIDPHLLETTKVPEFRNVYQSFQKHFREVITLLQQAKSPRGEDKFFRAAHEKLTFPELPFVSLGYSSENSFGKGIGWKLAERIAVSAWEIIQAGISDPVIFELVGLFEKDIGADRISDMIIHIIYDDLLAFSERVARNLNLKTSLQKVCGKNVFLPTIVETNKPIVLLPYEILTDLPIANGPEDIERVCAHNEDLRNRINRMIASFLEDSTRKRRSSLTKTQFKSMLLDNPDILKDLIEQYKKNPAEHYDFENDPAGYFRWLDIAKDAINLFPLLFDVNRVTPENILQVVFKICNHFKELVEKNGLAMHFWDNSGKLRHERFAQLLFFAIGDAYCEARNLDLNREPNAGRGAVDFKISKGYCARVNIEIKYTSNKQIKQSYENQLSIYNAAERTEYSIFLVIQTTPDISKLIEDLEKLRKSKVSKGERPPEIFVIDGRVHHSASKVK